MEAINQRKAHHIAEMIRRNISDLRKSGADIGKVANVVFDMIDDLAVELLKCTPPRNCDVGTTEEQAQRFHQFCMARQSPNTGVCVLTCPCGVLPDKYHCMTAWLQMPYIEKEGGNNANE